MPIINPKTNFVFSMFAIFYFALCFSFMHFGYDPSAPQWSWLLGGAIISAFSSLLFGQRMVIASLLGIIAGLII